MNASLMVLVQERDALLAETPQESTEPAAAEDPAAEDATGTETTVTEGDDGNGSFSLTVIVCVAVAGLCVLVASILAVLMFCGRGGADAEGEADEHMKGVHPFVDDSHLIDGDSKVRRFIFVALCAWCLWCTAL